MKFSQSVRQSVSHSLFSSQSHIANTEQQCNVQHRRTAQQSLSTAASNLNTLEASSTSSEQPHQVSGCHSLFNITGETWGTKR